MTKTSQFTSAILLSLLCATASAQDWVEKSNEFTTVVLKAQSQPQPEGASSLGFTEFDESVMDLGPDLFDRLVALEMTIHRIHRNGRNQAPQPLQTGLVVWFSKVDRPADARVHLCAAEFFV